MKGQAKHKLDFEDRMIIQACLHDNQTITMIARRLDVSKATISRELHRNADRPNHGTGNCPIKKFPVCNICKRKGFCSSGDKWFYNWQKAELLAKQRKRSSRSAPRIDEETLAYINEVVTSGVRLGQSLHHIYIGDASLQALVCERTIRRLIYRGNLDVRPHQLRRYVRFKHEIPRQFGELQVRDIRCLIGRTFKDFIRFQSSHKRDNVVQYDSIIGKIDDRKAILTITFPAIGFQFGLLIRKGSSLSVTTQLKALFVRLGPTLVAKLFPINLADNGTEFATFHRLETALDGLTSIHCFYTNPYRATDKAHCERNHELVRYCLPKGKSLNFLTQDIVDNMFSHINSYVRASKGDKTPYDLVKARFGKEFLDLINIVRIPNKKVKLSQIA